MTTLAGVTLSDNLHLIGFESSPPVAYSVRETLGGTTIVQMNLASETASLRLVARNDGISRMGCFTQLQLESLRAQAVLGQPVTLDHTPTGKNIQVAILEFNVEQSDERETPGDTKMFHGEILLQEV